MQILLEQEKIYIFKYRAEQNEVNLLSPSKKFAADINGETLQK